MAYETGTATNVDTLLSALAVFAGSNGWTINYNGNRTVSGANPGKALMITRNLAHTCFASFLSSSVTNASAGYVPYIQVYGHETYNAANGTELQSGASGLALSNIMPGPFASYHFFANENPSSDTYLHVVVEYSPGFYRHFGTGILNKFGGVTTGHYIYGTYWDQGTFPNYKGSPDASLHSVPFDSNEGNAPFRNRIRADRDGLSPSWATGGSSSGFFGQRSDFYAFASGQTQRAVLWPFLAYVTRPSSNNSLIGMPPNVRAVSLEYLLPGESLTLGSDTWKVFPIVRRNGNTGEENSGTYGIAYKV